MFWWTSRQLKSKSPERRYKAIVKMAAYDSPMAFKSLVDLRDDPSKDVRDKIQQSLNTFGTETKLAVAESARAYWKDALVYLLNDNNPQIRLTALKSLLQVGWVPATTREKILAAIEEKRWGDVKQYGHHAIEPLIDSLNARFKHNWILMDKASNLMKCAGTVVVEALILCLKDPSEIHRQQTIEALRILRKDDVLEALIDLAKTESFWTTDDAYKTKDMAVSALGEIGDSRAVEALIKAIDDRRVSGEAMRALGKIGGTQAATKLIELTRAGGSVALECLVQTKDEQAVDVLLEQLENPNSKLREEAASGLGTLKSTKAIEALISLMQDPDTKVRTQATRSLGSIGGSEALNQLVERFRQELQNNRSCSDLGYALSEFGDLALDKLAALFEVNDVQKRFLLVRALIGFSGKRAMEIRNDLQPKLDGLVFLFNSNFEPKEKFIDSILDKMQTHLRSYRNWMGKNTPIRVAIHPDAQNSTTFTSVGTVEFRRMIGDRFNLESMEYATFEGSQGIHGVILSHWS